MTDADQAVFDLLERWRAEGRPAHEILEAMARALIDIHAAQNKKH